MLRPVVPRLRNGTADNTGRTHSAKSICPRKARQRLFHTSRNRKKKKKNENIYVAIRTFYPENLRSDSRACRSFFFLSPCVYKSCAKIRIHRTSRIRMFAFRRLLLIRIFIGIQTWVFIVVIFVSFISHKTIIFLSYC